jgi:hypothetical protein
MVACWRGMEQFRARVCAHAELKKNAPPDSLSTTRVFERTEPNRKFRKKNGLNVSQNSFLISASQKVYGRLSLERAVHAE